MSRIPNVSGMESDSARLKSLSVALARAWLADAAPNSSTRTYGMLRAGLPNRGDNRSDALVGRRRIALDSEEQERRAPVGADLRAVPGHER